MTRPCSLLLAAALLAALASSGRADEGTGSAAEEAIKLPGARGLVGFGDMVDARSPGLLSIRLGTRYEVSVHDRDLETPTGGGASERTTRHALYTVVGLSLFGIVDAGARIPYLFESEEQNVFGAPEPGSDSDHGWGDLDLAGKVTLQLGWFSVAPYLLGRLPTAEPAVEDLAEFDYGASGTFAILSQYLSFHGNLYGIQRETGLSALGYRLGLAGVPFASDPLLLRLYAYVDGLEYEGTADSDVDVVFGVQAIVLESITAEIGVRLRVVDGGNVSDELRRALEGSGAGNPVGQLQDDGSWELHLGLGTAF